MSDTNTPWRQEPSEPRSAPNSEGGLRAPPGLSSWGKAWWWFHFVILVKLARLRFIAILVAIGAVIIYWETLYAYYERWTRPFTRQEQTVSADTEYWCPMHPSIIREKPDKCPICAMPLSKRKKGEKGEEETLPAGILSRVQLTPYKIAQSGLQLAEIGFLPLVKEIKTVGFVEFNEEKLARISARVPGKSRIDKLFVNVTGQMVSKGDPLALLYSPDLVVTVQNLLDARTSGNASLERIARDRLELWGIEKDQIEAILKTGKPTNQVTIRSPISGHVIKKYQFEGDYVEEGARVYDIADLSTVWIEAQIYEDEIAFVRTGLPVSATASAFPSKRFPGKLAFVHPHLDWASRTIRVRFDVPNSDHELRPGMYATATITVPVNELSLLSAGMTASPPSSKPGEVPGQETKEQAVEKKAKLVDGLVLAVPERSVIDTGSRKIVYREYLPNEYEGVLVELGPRMMGPDKGVYYPVVQGLHSGDKVVTTGSFLIDAETRLTAGASSTYFGASGGPQGTEQRSAVTAEAALIEDEEAKVKAALSKLSTPDRRLAEAQVFCPVLQDSPLGSMGVPVKVLLQGQPVFLCCAGCKEKAKAHADQTLDRANRLKARPKGEAKKLATAASVWPPLTPQESAEIKMALAKLTPEDRRLAEAQGLCAVMEKNYLGSMGAPIKVMVKGQPVFLCCDGCQERALANPGQTLSKVETLKKAKKTPSAK